MAEPPLQSRIVDDKSPICIPFILEQLERHKAEHPDRPFIVGLNGVQGVGKTTLVKAIADTLTDREGLRTLVCSIDDFYLTHQDQLALAEAHPANALLQNRGEPGTHDIPLLTNFLAALVAHAPTRQPRYDKAAHDGQGDREPASTWPSVNDASASPVQVVVLEGWCVGFRALPEAELEARWRAGGTTTTTTTTLHRHRLEDLCFVNARLRDYDAVWARLDALVHVDAADTAWVYAWRRQQEAALRQARGRAGTGGGMADDAHVDRFVDTYYPAYELYLDRLRGGLFPDRPGRQLRVVVGEDRSVLDKMVI